ncbi:MAG: hypothetical protein BWY53_00342 [Parcubacteria group bacterium ADurb.Bin326]|nr:MAG: hypothetical protein BWY53_00342 [Parcubacteria group bacterium ADurb.Bin326]
MDKLITSINYSPTLSIAFSFRKFKGQNYIAITKFLVRGESFSKPIGGVVFTIDVFNKINDLLLENTEKLLIF